VDAIKLVNAKYNETLSLQYTTPRVVKGYMGTVFPQNIDLPQENLIITSELIF